MCEVVTPEVFARAIGLIGWAVSTISVRVASLNRGVSSAESGRRAWTVGGSGGRRPVGGWFSLISLERRLDSRTPCGECVLSSMGCSDGTFVCR